MKPCTTKGTAFQYFKNENKKPFEKAFLNLESNGKIEKNKRRRALEKEVIFTNSKKSRVVGFIKSPLLSEAPQIMALQEKVLSEMENPDLFALTNLEQIEESLKQDYCLGVYDQGLLIAFGLMITNRPTPRHSLHKLTAPEGKIGQSVTVDSIFVDQSYRGYGIQQKIFEAFDQWAQNHGIRYMHTTIAPNNGPSLSNAIKMGYKVLETKTMYGGRMRHILEKEVQS